MEKDELKRVKYITKTKRRMDAHENNARAKAHKKHRATALERMRESYHG